MNHCTAYLAGKIGGRTYADVIGERQHASEVLRASGIHVLCPMRGKEPLHQMVQLDREVGNSGFRNEELRSRDIADVLRADILIVLTGNTPSWGTGIEWGIAHIHNKPVFVIADDPAAMEVGFMGACCARAFPTVEELATYLRDTWLWL